MKRLIFCSLLALGLVVAWSLPTYAVDPAIKCEASKLKEAGKYANCRLKAHATAVTKALAPDFLKCEEKFTPKFTGLETKAGAGVCPTEGDEPALNARVTADADEIASLLSGGDRYEITLGGLTVIDHLTGLEWQRTDDNGGLTDKDNSYSWGVIEGAPDGSVFTQFLAGLNSCERGNVPPVIPGYAGRCDWRMPQIDELMTILLQQYPCGTDPCIDQIAFGPTDGRYYWSATSDADDLYYAWWLSFGSGRVGNDIKSWGYAARAVRHAD